MSISTAYSQLAEQLAGDIVDGRYPLGSRLPTEAELCRETGLARGTVRQALQRIQDAGMISRRPGDGSRVVALAPIDDYQPVAGSPDDIVTLVQRTKILHPQVTDVVADTTLARRLGASRGSKWYLTQGPRVRRGRRQLPLCWSEHYLPAGSRGLGKLLSGDFTASEAGEYDTEQVVSASALDERLAMALDSDCAAALVVTRRQRAADGRLVAVGIHTHPADRYELRTMIERRRSWSTHDACGQLNEIHPSPERGVSRVAIVTGGASGIGLATVRRLEVVNVAVTSFDWKGRIQWTWPTSEACRRRWPRCASGTDQSTFWSIALASAQADLLILRQIVVHVNGTEMAWTNENIVTIGDQTHSSMSIETFSWEPNGDLTIKTYYDMPESIGEEDDPYEHILGADNVIPNA
jgi:GntR family transcriptional regulator